MTPIAAVQCATCIFREDGQQVELRAGRLAEIQAYLLRGVPHLCHAPQIKGGESKIACRGGRDFQLQCWYRMGLIPDATDAALEETMERMGIPTE